MWSAYKSPLFTGFAFSNIIAGPVLGEQVTTRVGNIVSGKGRAYSISPSTGFGVVK
jgi:hypothetical protein